MTAIILVWNPVRWNDWDYDTLVEQVAETGQVRQRWSAGRHRNVQPGDTAWLLLQGPNRHGRGLIGHGTVTSETYEAPHYSDPAATMLYISVSFDALLPLGSQILMDVLTEAVPGVQWGSARSSGRRLRAAAEKDLQRLWLDLGPKTGFDPLTLTPGTYPEGSVARVEVNRYERSAEARRVCLAYHGTFCAACGFSFEIRYGEAGKDFIHVHHIVPVSQLGSGYELDPVTDLVPLCANCHAMAHQGVSTPRTVAELRRIITGAGFLAGATVTPEELEAEREARRMLGP
jgi:5-methylcytosine-specific restriction protein A